jgi:hypothetical protein
MTTNFPASIDAFTNPTSVDTLDNPPHDQQHADINDAMEAVQAKVGVDGSAVTGSLDYKVAQQGLTFIKSQAIGSGVSSVTVTDAFSATFENYLITLAGGSSTVAGRLGLQLGSETSAYYGSFIYALFSGGSPAQVNDNNAAQFTHIASTGGSFLSAQINIHMPFTATQTTVSSQGVTYGAVNGTYNGVLATSTSYSSFVFVCGSGTMTGGTIRVYGYNNG